MAESSTVARLAAEFIGTFVLVFTVGCNVLSEQPVWGGVSIACSLTVMIYALGKSSGAHFNPAVSLALGLNKTHLWGDVAKYMAVQFAGGIVGALSYTALFGKTFGLGFAATHAHSMLSALLAEALYTFLLCFVVLNVAVSRPHASNNQFYGVAIGFVIVAGAYGAGTISGGCFNPAVALGIDVASGSRINPVVCFVYVIAEFVGAMFATLAFWVCRPNETRVIKFGAVKTDHDGTCLYPITSKLASEFIGTYFLVLTVGLNVLGGSPAGAFSIACSLMCLIYALGSVSGAHFNPAVTVAIRCAGRDKISTKDAALYIVVQVVAGIFAGQTYAALHGGKTFALKPETSNWAQVLSAELVFTFVLAFVVLSVATSKVGLSEYFGFAIGMCVTAGGCAIGKISGGSLNPAVSIAISSSHLMNGGPGWPCLVYSVFEILAGVAAAYIFMLTCPSEFDTKQDAFGSSESRSLTGN